MVFAATMVHLKFRDREDNHALKRNTIGNGFCCETSAATVELRVRIVRGVNGRRIRV